MKSFILRTILLFNCLSCSSPVEENTVINFEKRYPSILKHLTEKRSVTESVAIEVKKSLEKALDKEYTDKIASEGELLKIIINIMSLEDLQKAKEVSEKIAEGSYKRGAHDDQVLNELEEILGHRIVSTKPNGRYGYMNRYNSYDENKDYGEIKEEDLTALKRYVDTKKSERNNTILDSESSITSDSPIDTEPSMNKDVREALRILSSIRIYLMSLREIEELVKAGEKETGYINFSEKLLDLLTHPINIEDLSSDSSSKDNQKERDQGSTNKVIKDSLRNSIPKVIKQLREKIEDIIFPVVRNNLCAVAAIMNKKEKKMVEIEVDENKLVRITITTKKSEYIKGILSYLERIAGSNFPVYELIFEGTNFKEGKGMCNLSHNYMKNIKRIKLQGCYFENSYFDISDIDSDCLESIEELRIYICYIKDLGSLKNLKSLKVLDICYHGLLNIPTSIIESVNLVELRIRKFSGSTIGNNKPFRNIEEITKLVNLKAFSLSHNELECIPEAITRIVNLKKLVLNCNRISTIDKNINKLVNLEELILDNNEAFKSSINLQVNLPNLKYLSMKNCNLPEIEKYKSSSYYSSEADNHIFYSNLLENLPKLERLDLSCNGYMDILPPEILKMGNLKYLYVKGNKIGSDPKKGLFGSVIKGDEPLLTSLKRLVLDSNNIPVFPSDIFRLRALEELSMNECKFKSLEKQSTISYTLRTLMSIIGWRLKQISGEIKSLENIKILSLSNNDLEVLPSEIGNLRKLEYLDLSGNRLKVLPSEIGSLTNLKYLYLLRNELKVLPLKIGNLTSLEYLYLSENKHLFTPDNMNTIFNIKSLKRLEMAGCGLKGRLSKDLGNLTNLRDLNLSKSGNLVLPGEIANLKELRELYLEDIEMPTKKRIVDSKYLLLPEKPFKLPNLRLLSLRKTKLSRFPDIICEFKSLNTLNMGYTGIKELPKPFSNLKSLRKLSMRNNEIEEIPKEIFNISTLECLNLSSNSITEVPYDILKLSKLETLDIRTSEPMITFPGNIVFLLSLKTLYVREYILENCSSEYLNFLESYRKIYI